MRSSISTILAAGLALTALVVISARTASHQAPSLHQQVEQPVAHGLQGEEAISVALQSLPAAPTSRISSELLAESRRTAGAEQSSELVTALVKSDVLLDVRSPLSRQWRANDLVLRDQGGQQIALHTPRGYQAVSVASSCYKQVALEPGHYTLDDMRTALRAHFHVQGDARGVERIQVELGPAAQVVVFPARTDDVAFDGWVVAHRSWDGEPWSTVGMRLDGAFSFHLAPGTYTFEAHCRDGSVGRLRSEVAASTLDLLLEIAPRIRSSLELQFVRGSEGAHVPYEWAETIRVLDNVGKPLPLTRTYKVTPSGPRRITGASRRVAEDQAHSEVVGLLLHGSFEGDVLVHVPAIEERCHPQVLSASLVLGEPAVLQVPTDDAARIQPLVGR